MNTNFETNIKNIFTKYDLDTVGESYVPNGHLYWLKYDEKLNCYSLKFSLFSTLDFNSLCDDVQSYIRTFDPDSKIYYTPETTPSDNNRINSAEIRFYLNKANRMKQ